MAYASQAQVNARLFKISTKLNTSYQRKIIERDNRISTEKVIRKIIEKEDLSPVMLCLYNCLKENYYKDIKQIIKSVYQQTGTRVFPLEIRTIQSILNKHNDKLRRSFA